MFSSNYVQYVLHEALEIHWSGKRLLRGIYMIYKVKQRYRAGKRFPRHLRGNLGRKQHVYACSTRPELFFSTAISDLQGTKEGNSDSLEGGIK